MSMSVTLPNLTIPYQIIDGKMTFEVGSLNNAAALLLAIGAGPIFKNLLEVSEAKAETKAKTKVKPLNHRALLTAVAGMIIGGWPGSADNLVQAMTGCSSTEADRVVSAIQSCLESTHFVDIKNNAQLNQLTAHIVINPEA